MVSRAGVSLAARRRKRRNFVGVGELDMKI